jgi:hypothetical protein
VTGVPLVVDPTADLLRGTLEIGVPLRIAEYRADRRPVDWLIDRAKAAVPLLCEYGTALMWRQKPRTHNGKRLPGTAEVCNALIEAVACAALVADGGITFLGRHWDAHIDWTDSEATDA